MQLNYKKRQKNRKSFETSVFVQLIFMVVTRVHPGRGRRGRLSPLNHWEKKMKESQYSNDNTLIEMTENSLVFSLMYKKGLKIDLTLLKPTYIITVCFPTSRH